MKLTVIGTTFVDIKGYPLGKFNPKGRNAGRMQQFHGGVSRNIAEDIANRNIDVNFVSLVDEGGIGADVVKHLADSNVNTDYIRATPDGMGTWLAIFDPSGDVYASISKRPHLLPICDILSECGDEIFSQSDAILLEIDIDEEIVAQTFELAQNYNKPVYSVISNITVALSRMEYIMKSSCFVCNRIEAADFFGCSEDDFSTPEKALQTIQALLPQKELYSMVVTLDKDGAVFFSKSGECGICEPLKVKVIDSTGAGDAFFSGVSIALAQGDSLASACRLGNEMAAKVITTLGNVYTEN